MYLYEFARLEPVLKDHGFVIANKPPTDENGLFSGFQFFTVYYNGQFYCIDVLKDELSVKIYKRIAPFKKQRVCKSIVIRENIAPNDIVADEDIEGIIKAIETAPYYNEPLDGYDEQWLYGFTVLFDLDGSYSRLFLDTLGEHEQAVLQTLAYVENTKTTLTSKILVFHAADGGSFIYDIENMEVIL